MKYFQPILVILCALSISLSAAYFSVSGLAMLFAGGGVAIIIMAASLEVSKIVISVILHSHWDKLNKLLRIYLTIATCVLILLTSVGIYGLLSSAYQKTAGKMGIEDKKIELINLKKSRWEKNIEELNSEKTGLENSIATLREGLTKNVIQYKDKDGNILTSTSSANRKSYEKQLESALNKKEIIDSKIVSLNDSVNKLEVEAFSVKSNSEVSAELGPLIYLSKITGLEMDRVINYLILVIIFVFDPLAISLVITAAYLFNSVGKKPEPEQIKTEIKTPEYVIYNEKPVEEQIEETKPLETTVEEPQLIIKDELPIEVEPQIKEEIVERPLVEEPITEEWKIEDEQPKPTTNSRIKELMNQLDSGSLSSWRRNKILNEIMELKKSNKKNNSDDDLTIKYN